MLREEIKDKYRKDATKNWCPKCEYYKTQKCEDWSIGETNICEVGYTEYLEDQLADKELLIDEVIEEIERLKKVAPIIYQAYACNCIEKAIQIIKDKLKEGDK